MKQEDKEILLRDLCSRLPYEVKIQYEDNIFTIDYISAMYEEIKLNTPNKYTIDVLEVKPYLFPLSSMTEEQEMEYDATFDTIVYEDGRKDSVMTYKSFDWLNKNNFDYRGLIPMGLAIDATNLNIY